MTKDRGILVVDKGDGFFILTYPLISPNQTRRTNMRPDKSDVVIKYRKKPTPIKTAVCWISLTTNFFMLLIGHYVLEGKIERREPTYVEQMIDAPAIHTAKR